MVADRDFYIDDPDILHLHAFCNPLVAHVSLIIQQLVTLLKLYVLQVMGGGSAVGNLMFPMSDKDTCLKGKLE